MVRAWRSADVAACRAISNPAWYRIFKEISCFSTLNLGTLRGWYVLGQGTSPSNASLHSGENEYLVGQRWQCARYVQGRRSGCRTVDGTRMNRSSNQGVKM